MERLKTYIAERNRCSNHQGAAREPSGNIRCGGESELRSWLGYLFSPASPVPHQSLICEAGEYAAFDQQFPPCERLRGLLLHAFQEWTTSSTFTSPLK